MWKGVLGAIAVFLCVSFPVGSEQGYTVSGTATFQEGGLVLLSLFTHEKFLNLRNNPLPPPPFSLVIEPSLEEKKAGRAPFRFEGIPRGTYALMAFRDRNTPGSEAFPGKPASAYKMMAFSGRWEEVKVEVNRNITGIEIRFEDY
jgi:hypothetical protein